MAILPNIKLQGRHTHVRMLCREETGLVADEADVFAHILDQKVLISSDSKFGKACRFEP